MAKNTWSEDAELILDGGIGDLSPALIEACRAGGRALARWHKEEEGRPEYSRAEGLIWERLDSDHRVAGCEAR